MSKSGNMIYRQIARTKELKYEKKKQQIFKLKSIRYSVSKTDENQLSIFKIAYSL